MTLAAYVSPVTRARELASSVRSGKVKLPRRTRATTWRIARLEPLIVSDLEAMQAPFKTIRWVAWGEDATERRRRADLVLHLRRTINTTRGGWLREAQLQAALDVVLRLVREARQRGLAQPRPQDVSTPLYQDALHATRTASRSNRRPPAPTKAEERPPLMSDEEVTVLKRVLERMV